MKQLVFILVTLFLADQLSAQDYYKIFEWEYELSPNNAYDDLPENSVDVQEHEANLSLPLQRENGDAIVIGMGYNNFRLFPSIDTFDRQPDTFLVHDHIYTRFRAQVGYSKKIDDRSSIVAMGFFRVASDMIDVQSSHFLYGGLIMKTTKRSEKFTLKWGLYANTEHYGWLIIPLIGCDWKVSDKFRVYGVLPRRLTGAWTLSEKFRTGFIFEAPNRTYRISEGRMQTSNGQVLDGYVQNIKNVVYGMGELYLTKGLVIRGRIGYTIARDFALYEYQTDQTFITWGIDYGAERTEIQDVPAYRNFRDGLILDASLEYRFSLE